MHVQRKLIRLSRAAAVLVAVVWPSAAGRFFDQSIGVFAQEPAAEERERAEEEEGERHEREALRRALREEIDEVKSVLHRLLERLPRDEQ